MSAISERDRFWGHATAFGAMWGALEVTVGTFLHALRIPFGGTVLAATGAALLLALRVVYPRRGVVLAAGAVCAGVKLLSPATSVLGPTIGILVESLLVELACFAFGANPVSAALGGALATLWTLSQKVLTQVVLYGAPVLDLYREFLRRAEAWLRLPPSGGLRVVLPFAALVAVIGACVAMVGYRAGHEAFGEEPEQTHHGDTETRSFHSPPPCRRASVVNSGRPDSSTRSRHLAVLMLAVGLLGGLALTRPVLHGVLGLATFAAAFALDAPVARRLGSPRRWLVAVVALAVLGLWLGPRDARLAGFAVSSAGALAAATMVARAVALVLVGASAIALWPPAQALAGLRGTRLRRFAEVLVVALELVPSLVTALRAARRDVKDRVPGWHRAPRRTFETFVFAVEHASALAESAARDLATPDREDGRSLP